MKRSAIGIFDSGIGGLTVFKQVKKELPKESIIYLGDTARVPYGTRSKQVIKKFALELAKYLLRADVKFLVVSCNTISATCLDEIVKMASVPVIGVIDSAVKEATKVSKNKKIGVIGTNATINSGIYEKKLKQQDKAVQVYSQSGSLFVPLVEEGFNHHQATKQIAQDYLKVFKETGIDTLILGCTHFPLIKDVIQTVIGDNIKIIDSAVPTAKNLKEQLRVKGLLNRNLPPTYKILVTDAPDRVYEVSKRFFGNNLPCKPKKITL